MFIWSLGDKNIFAIIGLKLRNEWDDLSFLITSLEEQQVIKSESRRGIDATS